MEVVKEQPQWFKGALAVDHRDDFVQVSGAKIHFMEWGSSDNPSVIMLHGNHAHAHWFQFIGGLLAKKYHFVVMSFSGMGEMGGITITVSVFPNRIGAMASS